CQTSTASPAEPGGLPMGLEALYATITLQQKLDHALAPTSAGQELVLGRIRMQHPEETNREHRIRLMSR
ncbi:MAG: hypothetical protein ACE5IL_17815, partial [Myxococcota bacterium]